MAPYSESQKITQISGTPAQMGRQIGLQLQPYISQMKQTLKNLEGFRLLQPRYVPYPLFLKAACRAAKNQLEKACVEEPETWAKLMAISEGAQADIGLVCLINSLEATMSKLNADLPTSIGGCSSVAIHDPKKGATFIGRNFDYINDVTPYYICRQVKPTDGYSFSQFSLQGLAGSIDGINEHGLAITFDYGYVKDAPKPALPISVMIQKALSQCKTVEEAITLIEKTTRWGGALLMLADASGDMAAVEISNSKTGIRRANGKNLLNNTNHFLNDEMKAVQVDRHAVYSKKSPKHLRGKSVFDNSYHRAKAMMDSLAKLGDPSFEDVDALLGSHGTNGTIEEGGIDTVCVHTDYWSTTATFKYHCQKREMHFSFSSACKPDWAVIKGQQH